MRYFLMSFLAAGLVLGLIAPAVAEPSHEMRLHRAGEYFSTVPSTIGSGVDQTHQDYGMPRAGLLGLWHGFVNGFARLTASAAELTFCWAPEGEKSILKPSMEERAVLVDHNIPTHSNVVPVNPGFGWGI